MVIEDTSLVTRSAFIRFDFDTFYAVKHNLEYWHVYWIFECGEKYAESKKAAEKKW